jgi:hypothetical protein
MKDKRYAAAYARAAEIRHAHSLRLHDSKLELLVEAVLQDDTEHDITRFGRHLDRATEDVAT